MTRAVLIVDDDQFIRRLIATTLEDVGDFDLHEAADGRQALEVTARQEPSLVFLDVDMPELNGIDACRELRHQEATSQATSEVAQEPPPPPRIDRELNDGDELPFGDGAVAVAAPGHTPGSVAIHLPRH